jgi:broad specificity phosphatase PhoE
LSLFNSTVKSIEQSIVHKPPAALQFAAHNYQSSGERTIYFVRHAQSLYNSYKLNPLNWLLCGCCRDPMIYDAAISSKGKLQLIKLKETAEKLQLQEECSLVLSSPLIRAVHTAAAIIGQIDNNGEIVEKPRQIEMKEMQGNNTSNPIDSLQLAASHAHFHFPLPLVLSPLCSEIVDTSCDIGSETEILSKLFPFIDFTHYKTDWWYYDKKLGSRSISDEPKRLVQERTQQFAAFVLNLPPHFSSIVVVSHSNFIRHCLGTRQKLANCAIHKVKLTFDTTSNKHKFTSLQKYI